MRAVFEGIVDYAGLFPPASLGMGEAVASYRDYRRSSDRWMLGRFIVAATRLTEFGEAIERLEPDPLDPSDPWRVSVVTGAILSEELALIDAFRERWDGRGVQVDSLEHRVASVAQVQVFGDLAPRDYLRFLEFPPEGPYDELAASVASIGAFAKFRTGGITPQLFPEARELARFLVAVTAHGVRFKATAGLHHPIRGSFPLTYAAGAERHTMYGFVNVLLATAELLRGGELETVQQLLEEADRSAIRHEHDGISWRGVRYPAAELVRVRERAFTGFGSCSFREPVDELQAMVVT